MYTEKLPFGSANVRKHWMEMIRNYNIWAEEERVNEYI